MLLNLFNKNNRIKFTRFIYDYCAKTKRDAAFKRRYRRLARLLTEFETYIGAEIYTDSFDYNISEEFISWLTSIKPSGNKANGDHFRSSSIRNFIRGVVSMLNKAEKSGYTVVNVLSEFPFKAIPCSAVYLTIEELNKLSNLNLRKESAQVRDLFLIGCCTALRFSDYSRLERDNIHNNNIRILTQKTKEEVVIPLHPLVREVLKRNEDYSFLNYEKSLQNFNKRIRSICKKADIDDIVMSEFKEGNKIVKKKYKKWEMVSSHTARRTGATLMYIAGIPLYRIMLITGHTSESSILRYIRIRKEENAEELSNHPFFS